MSATLNHETPEPVVKNPVSEQVVKNPVPWETRKLYEIDVKPEGVEDKMTIEFYKVEVDKGTWRPYDEQLQEKTGLKGFYRVSEKSQPLEDGGRRTVHHIYQVRRDRSVKRVEKSYERTKDGGFIDTSFDNFFSPQTLGAKIIEKVDPDTKEKKHVLVFIEL